MAAGALDGQGVWQYGEDDPLSPFSTFMNLLAASASSAVAAKAVGGLANGYAALSANSTVNATTAITTTPVDVPGLAVTVQLPAARRIKVSFDGMLYSNVAGDRAQVGIREGTTLLAYNQQPMNAAGTGYGLHLEVVLTPTAGTHTYKISIGRAGGTGNINTSVSVPGATFILVEDIGPAR
jgi:hypothetical protein